MFTKITCSLIMDSLKFYTKFLLFNSYIYFNFEDEIEVKPAWKWLLNV